MSVLRAWVLTLGVSPSPPCEERPSWKSLVAQAIQTTDRHKIYTIRDTIIHAIIQPANLPFHIFSSLPSSNPSPNPIKFTFLVSLKWFHFFPFQHHQSNLAKNKPLLWVLHSRMEEYSSHCLWIQKLQLKFRSLSIPVQPTSDILQNLIHFVAPRASISWTTKLNPRPWTIVTPTKLFTLSLPQ